MDLVNAKNKKWERNGIIKAPTKCTKMFSRRDKMGWTDSKRGGQETKREQADTTTPVTTLVTFSFLIVMNDGESDMHSKQ